MKKMKKNIFTRKKIFLIVIFLIILFQIIKDRNDFINGLTGN
ncbi:hypothetical protein IQ02_02001 [Flavobacterium glaciei]|uniref:Uncharacterized protein n=1 Tax=Flavobacterium glaciei TaxID=386300 RepID=A0A562PPT9_9FLAO|nr:hypothetical protein DFR66_109142 [Flavobacterium glaciei]TWI46477.1 hypothetical protein IQ02_02001 [Flavobacterium glaciei]